MKPVFGLDQQWFFDELQFSRLGVWKGATSCTECGYYASFASEKRQKL